MIEYTNLNPLPELGGRPHPLRAAVPLRRTTRATPRPTRRCCARTPTPWPSSTRPSTGAGSSSPRSSATASRSPSASPTTATTTPSVQTPIPEPLPHRLLPAAPPRPHDQRLVRPGPRGRAADPGRPRPRAPGREGARRGPGSRSSSEGRPWPSSSWPRRRGSTPTPWSTTATCARSTSIATSTSPTSSSTSGSCRGGTRPSPPPPGTGARSSRWGRPFSGCRSTRRATSWPARGETSRTATPRRTSGRLPGQPRLRRAGPAPRPPRPAATVRGARPFLDDAAPRLRRRSSSGTWSTSRS